MINNLATEQEIFKYNNLPQEKLSGLSPSQTHEVIHNMLGEKCCLQFRSNLTADVLNQIPFFRISEKLLEIIQRDGFIKPTPLGALPKKVLVELYNYKFITDELIESGISKLHHEDYCIAIKTARIVCQLTNFVKKSNGKLLLTKNGERCLKAENRVELFKMIFLTFTEKFNWAFNDGYPSEPTGQFGYLFTIYLLKKFGKKEESTDFYALRYLRAFEKFITFFNEDYTTPENQFKTCFNVRTFERFTEWFGLTTIVGEKRSLIAENIKIVKTDLLDKIFVYA